MTTSPLKVQFLSPQADLFTETLRRRVDDYFTNRRLSKKANLTMVLKSILYLVGFAATYFAIFVIPMSSWTALGLCLLLGLWVSGIGFNISHDALHGAYSNHKWVNTLMGHTFSIVGANVYVWNIIHNVVHHSYTNIPEADGDLHSVGALKFFKSPGSKPYHRYQHWYAFFLYGLTSLMWVFIKDFKHMRRKVHMVYEKPELPRSEIFNLVFFKTAYYLAFLVLPMVLTPFAWWQIALGFVAMHLVTGFTLALTFQLGHLVEGTILPNLKENEPLPNTWAAHQLKTTANFAANKPWVTWIFGGLNYQVEHHLFPKICHVHYPKISQIVKQTALEFGLPYHSYDTFTGAVKSHVRYLKEVGHDSAAA